MSKIWYPETLTVEIVDKDNAHRMVSVLPTEENPNINWIVITGPDGSSVWKTTDSTYKISDIDKWTSYYYYWKTDKDWAWYIMRKELSTNSFRYVKWTNDYLTNWSNRVSLTYNLWS